jgi:hypothetical protein
VTMSISDPNPPYCSACLGAASGTRFVDLDAAYDGGAFVGREMQDYIVGTDDLHLCESCVRDAAETLALKPQAHAEQAREIRRLTTAVDHWRDYARTLEATLEGRPELAPRAKRKVPA